MTSTAIAPTETVIDTARVDYIDGLRQLADMLERNEDFPLPFEGSGDTPGQRLTFYFLGGVTEDEAKAGLVQAARLFPGKVRKEQDDSTCRIIGKIAGLPVQAVAYRSAVCERIVTGVETVTETVPDPAALALVPSVEVTREVETVEWKCSPLLSDEARAASPFGPVRKGLV